MIMDEVYRQLFCLVIFMITGIVIGVLFDLFRILRKSFKTADWIIYLQDIVFWILAGFIVLFSIFTFNHGEIRSYVLLGLAFGIIIYMITISKFIVKYCVILIKWITKIFSYPLKLIKKILIVPLHTFLKKCQQIVKLKVKK